MSARPGDWSLLELSEDPFPGDEHAVTRQASHYQNVADAISDQITNLRKISNGSAKGLYVDKLADDAKDIANDLSKVENRFSTVASQLKVWQPVLAEGRSKSATLLREAETAHSAMAANKPPTKPLPHDASDAQVSAEKSRSRNYSTAQGDLNGYVRQMRTEIEHVRSVAKRVAGKINDASDDDVADSWWDSHVRKWIQDHAHLIDIIVKVLEIAAIVIAVAALIIATGGFGAFAALGITTAAWMGTAAEIAGLVLSGGLLLGHAAEMNAGVNDAGWGDIALDVFSLATFGASRAFTSLASRSLARATSRASGAATDAAVNGLASNVKNALRIGSESNPLRVWAAGQRSAAIATAQQNLRTALDVLPRTLSVNLAGSRELAEALAKARVLENYPAAAAAATRALNLTRGGIAISVIDRLHLADDIRKVPKTIRELTGGGGEDGGG